MPNEDHSIFRLAFAWNQLDALNIFNPDLEVLEATGFGSMSTPSAQRKFAYGKIITQQISHVFFNYSCNKGKQKIEDIWKTCKAEGIPNIAFDTLVYRDVIHYDRHDGKEIGVVMTKDSIQRGKLKKLVCNGRYPKEEMYQTVMIMKDLQEEYLKLIGIVQ